jgi:tRNA nucleotidyltransferase/poly(A) polymerase
MHSFEVHSALGRCRFTPSKSPTPVAVSTRHLPLPEDSDLPLQDLVRKQNEQLSQLKDQYLRLHEQLKEEQKESSAKLLNLQREFRAEQKQVEELEDEIAALIRMGQNRTGERSGSMQAVEQIWQLMQEYREAVQPTAARGRKEEEPELQRVTSPRMRAESPRTVGRMPDGTGRRGSRF